MNDLSRRNEIRVLDDQPLLHSYAMSHNLSRLKLDTETGMGLGTIEQSKFAVLFVASCGNKKDGTHCFHLDYQHLNIQTTAYLTESLLLNQLCS